MTAHNAWHWIVNCCIKVVIEYKICLKSIFNENILEDCAPVCMDQCFDDITTLALCQSVDKKNKNLYYIEIVLTFFGSRLDIDLQ